MTDMANIEDEHRAEFTVGEHSARHLRRILRLQLAGAGMPEAADAAELALTELVADVVRHVPGRHCRICFLLRRGGVRVEIADSCSRLPVQATGDTLADGGRGLLLVDAVTDRWGVEPHSDGSGTTVWFECLPRHWAEGETPCQEYLSPAPPRAPRP
jgi:hypothetical protein